MNFLLASYQKIVEIVNILLEVTYLREMLWVKYEKFYFFGNKLRQEVRKISSQNIHLQFYAKL